jgi:Domain of unknown function (DUF4386)
MAARLIGILFLLLLFSYGGGDAVISSVLQAPNYLSTISAKQTTVIAGALLLLVNSCAVVMLGAMMFPVLAARNKRVAVGYVSARVIESVLLLCGSVCLLLLIGVGEEFIKGSAANTVYFQALAHILRKANFWLYQSAMIILGVGSLGLCWVLYSSGLLPKSLSLLGFVGYGLLAAGALAELFGVTVGVALAIPGGIFELLLGLWLIVKGFNESTVGSHSLPNSAE